LAEDVSNCVEVSMALRRKQRVGDVTVRVEINLPSASRTKNANNGLNFRPWPSAAPDTQDRPDAIRDAVAVVVHVEYERIEWWKPRVLGLRFAWIEATVAIRIDISTARTQQLSRPR